MYDRRQQKIEYLKNCKPINYFKKVKTDKRKNNKRPPYKDRSLIKEAITFLVPRKGIELVGGKKQSQQISKELFCQYINHLKQENNG